MNRLLFIFISFLLIFINSILADDLMKPILDQLKTDAGRQELSIKYNISELTKEPDESPITEVLDASLEKGKKHKIVVYSIRSDDAAKNKHHIIMIFEITNKKATYITYYIHIRDDADIPNNNALIKTVSCIDPDENEIFIEDTTYGPNWYQEIYILKLKSNSLEKIFSYQVTGWNGSKGTDENKDFWVTREWHSDLNFTGDNWPKVISIETFNKYCYYLNEKLNKKEDKDFTIEFKLDKETFKYIEATK